MADIEFKRSYVVCSWILNDITNAFPQDFEHYFHIARITNHALWTQSNDINDLLYNIDSIDVKPIDVEEWISYDTLQPLINPDTNKFCTFQEAPIGELSTLLKIPSRYYDQLDNNKPIKWVMPADIRKEFMLSLHKCSQHMFSMLNNELFSNSISKQMKVCIFFVFFL